MFDDFSPLKSLSPKSNSSCAISPGKTLFMSLGPMPQFDKIDDISKIRIVFNPFNELYEFNNLRNAYEFEIIQKIIPLFEGQIIYLMLNRPQHRCTSEFLAGKERLLRLTPDINRLEFRFIGNTPLYKIDLFIKVD